MPYNYEILYELSGDALTICKLEMLNHKKLKDVRYTPKIKFGGSKYECFSFIDINDLITELSNE